MTGENPMSFFSRLAEVLLVLSILLLCAITVATAVLAPSVA